MLQCEAWLLYEANRRALRTMGMVIYSFSNLNLWLPWSHSRRIVTERWVKRLLPQSQSARMMNRKGSSWHALMAHLQLGGRPFVCFCLFFFMEIHIAYCSDLTVWISFLAGFSFWNFFPMSQCLSVESRPLRAGSTWLFFWALTCFITLVSHFCGDHKFGQVSAKCWRSVRQVSARYQWTEKLCWPTYISTDCQSSVDGHSTEWQQSIDLVLTATSTDKQ